MAIVKMSKLSIIGLLEDRDPVMDEMHKLGCVQITNTDPMKLGSDIEKYEHDNRSEQIDGFLGDIIKARDAITPFDKRKKNMFEPKLDIDLIEFEKHINRETQIFSKVSKINDLLEQKDELLNEENKLNNQKDNLAAWSLLDLSLSLKGTNHTTFLMGVIPITFTMDQIKEEIQSEFKETYIREVSSDSLQYYVFLIILNQNYDQVTKIIRKYNFNPVTFSDINMTPKDAIKKIDARLDDISASLNVIHENIKEFANSIEEIELLYDYLILEKQKIEQVSMFVKTKKAFMLEGWIPDKQIDNLLKNVHAAAQVYIDLKKPEKDEAFPIALENGKFVKSFELITELFSLPNHKEFDVNPFMSPFYFVFFGLMLGDAGYGLVLSLITGFILFKFDLKGTMKKLISMVFLGGISTFIWGVLFGSWFGDIFKQVSDGRFNIKPLWFDPLNDPMKLLIWACALGVVQLYVGMGLKGYKMWMIGKKKDAVIDIGLRYAYYSGIIMLLASIPFAKYIAAFGAVGLLLTQGRHKKGFGKITGGLLSLYDFVGFMSDVLSYSRLLALGLATGVVASVINTMGTIFGMNVLGIIVLIVIFIGGHIFNIAINTLGAYVHASRLQYVEFFSKFYDGGGKPYMPFKYDTKYTNINNGGI